MVKIEIKDPIYEVLEIRAEEKDFDETDEYINYVLKQIADKVKREKEQQEGYSEEEEEEVKKRLKGLGYLD